MPGPTYPNRRFLLAGTAWGGTTTSPGTLLDPPPPHGTIFDRPVGPPRSPGANYFSDLPMTAVIPSIILKHSEHLHQLDKFFHDCQIGHAAVGQLRRPEHRRSVLDRAAAG